MSTWGQECPACGEEPRYADVVERLAHEPLCNTCYSQFGTNSPDEVLHKQDAIRGNNLGVHNLVMIESIYIEAIKRLNEQDKPERARLLSNFRLALWQVVAWNRC